MIHLVYYYGYSGDIRYAVPRWPMGGSCAIRLPKMAVESLGLSEGENVSLHIEDGALVIRPARPHYLLEDLIAEAQKLETPQVLDDNPVGDELL